MAASWGAGLFQDDLATDFANQIVDSDGLAVLHHALAQAGQASGHLLYEPAIRALISAEVVAALGGRPAKAMPIELSDWVARPHETIPGELRRLARAAVERVKQDSEISELWARSSEFARWIDKIDDLLGRLQP